MTSRFPRALSALLLTVLFVASRVVIHLVSLRPDISFVANDVSYYGYHLYRLEQGVAPVMPEYPPPALWIIHAIYRAGDGWQTWTPVFAATMLVLDGLVAVTLWGTGRARAALFWIIFTGANGAIAWYRFDLIPAALVAWACILLAVLPGLAGACIGIGAAVKFWPALLALPALAPDPRRGRGLRRLVGFLVAGLGLAAVSLAVEGWQRNVAPLEWQSERGLQIESVPATPIMVLRAFTDTPSWHIELSDYNALELFGPGVDASLAVSRVLTVASIALTLALTVLLVRRRAGREAVLLAMLTVILATIVANKTLSPQYVLWLGGPVAALLLHEGQPWLRRHVHVLAGALVVVGALTQYTYPWGARGIMALPLGSGPETSVLVLRNLLLVVLLVQCTWLTVKASAHDRDPLAKL